jgi:hypothetical protein
MELYLHSPNKPSWHGAQLKYRTSLPLLREIGWRDLKWINLNEDRDQWTDLVNNVMNLRIP